MLVLKVGLFSAVVKIREKAANMLSKIPASGTGSTQFLYHPTASLQPGGGQPGNNQAALSAAAAAAAAAEHAIHFRFFTFFSYFCCVATS